MELSKRQVEALLRASVHAETRATNEQIAIAELYEVEEAKAEARVRMSTYAMDALILRTLAYQHGRAHWDALTDDDGEVWAALTDG